MKKTLVVLLILAVAGGVFAQDITWSGEIRTGAKITLGDQTERDVLTGEVDPVTNKVKTENPIRIGADEDDVPTGVKARLNTQVAGDAWGVQIGLAADVDGQSALTKDVYVYNAHGWLDFVGGMLKVRAGLIDPGVWTTKGNEDWNLSSALGFRLEVTPIEGLNFGTLLNYGEANAGDMDLVDFLQETVFGASYSAPDMMGLYVSAAFKLDSSYAGASWDTLKPTDQGYDPLKPTANGYGGEDSTLIFGFGLNPMEPLVIKAEAKIESIGDYGSRGWMWFDEDASYQVMDALKVGMQFTQQLASEDVVHSQTNMFGKQIAGMVNDAAGYKDAHATTYLKFRPYAIYMVNDQLELGAEIPFDFANGQNIEGPDAQGDRLTQMAGREYQLFGRWEYESGIGVRSFGFGAWAQYYITPSVWIKGYYGFANTFAGFDKAPEYNLQGLPEYESKLDHTIRVLAGFTF